MKSNVINNNCWVACCDLLGFKAQIGKFEQGYDVGKLDIFLENFYKPILREFEEQGRCHPENVFTTQFSDTFVFFAADDSENSFGCLLGEVERFCIGSIRGMWPLRAAIGFGQLYADISKNVFFGSALIDAYEYAEKQNWIGLVITRKAERRLDGLGRDLSKCPIGFAKYAVPFKVRPEDDDGGGRFVRRIHQHPCITVDVKAMQHEATNNKDYEDKYKDKYENTLKFFKQCVYPVARPDVCGRSSASVGNDEEAMESVVLKVEESIEKWFASMKDCLTAYGSPQTPVDEVIMASVGVIERYLMSACVLAKHKAVLPVRALLRPVGEFTARLKYCVAGGTEEGVDERIQRWRKSSWKDYKSYWETVRNACKGSDCAHIDERIRQADSNLAQMTGLREFPQTRQILEGVFPQDLAVRVGVYAQYLSATHIDIVTLAQTVAEEGDTTEYVGDLVDDKPGIELDLLSLAYLYVETVSKHYGWDYVETLSEYKVLTHSNDGKPAN